MPRTIIGHARIARDLDVALRLLDFENYHRVFKFQAILADFEIGRFWGARSATET